MEESLGLGKKNCGTETVTETLSWFQLPIPKPSFGRILVSMSVSFCMFPCGKEHWVITYLETILKALQESTKLLQWHFQCACIGGC